MVMVPPVKSCVAYGIYKKSGLRSYQKTTFDLIDSIWLRLRSPFRYPTAGHQCKWERYDADRAGCVLCGALHRCASGIVGCTCPLTESDEGGHVCLITGLCICEVRTSCEFVDHAVFESEDKAYSIEDEGLHERAYAIVHGFLTSCQTADCRRLEQRKYVQKTTQTFWRVFRQRKRDDPYHLPCICSVVAEVAHLQRCAGSTGVSVMPVPLAEPPAGTIERIVQQAAGSITQCMQQIQRMGFRKVYHGSKFQSMVIGMMYLSRNGLKAGELFSLPAIEGISELLPSETYLNSLHVSNKVICDTENEIKSCIRAFTDPCADHKMANVVHSDASTVSKKVSSDNKPGRYSKIESKCPRISKCSKHYGRCLVSREAQIRSRLHCHPTCRKLPEITRTPPCASSSAQSGPPARSS